jgi:hypothetical protein
MLPIVLSLIAMSILTVGVVVFGSRKPGYGHVRDTISELGEIGAPHQHAVALALFAPIGLVLLVVAWQMHATQPAIAALAACISIGYLVAAAFPCDIGSPLSGSARQTIHNLGGGIEYVGGGFAMLRLSETLGPAFRFTGFVVLATAVALSIPPLAPVRGLVQRVAELGLFGGLVVATWRSANLA